MSINFENSMFVIKNATGTVEQGLIGFQECSGHVDFDIIDCNTDEKLGTAIIDIECYGMDATGYYGQNLFTIFNGEEEIFHAVFNTDDMEGLAGYNKFIKSIASATHKTTTNVKELLANAGEAIGRNSVVHKKVWNFGKH